MQNKKDIASKISLFFIFVSILVILLCIFKFIFKHLSTSLDNLFLDKIANLLKIIIPFGRIYILISFIVFLISLAFLFDSKFRLKNNSFFYRNKESILNNTKYVIIYFYTVTFLSILFLILLSFISWPSADDYLVYGQVRDHSLFGYMSYYYLNWDGRFSSFLIQSILFHVFNFNYSFLIVLISSISFITLIYLLSRFIGNLEKSVNWVYVFFINLPILFISLLPILREVVYWATGGIYVITSAIVFFWIYLVYLLLFRNLKLKNKFINIFFIIFSFLIGGISQNLSLSLIFLAISFLIISKKYCIYKINRIVILISLLFLIISSLLIYVAPGNYVRGAIIFNKLDFTIINLFKNYLIVIHNYSNILFRVIVFGVVSAIFTALICFNYSKNNDFSTKNFFNLNKFNFIIYSLFLIAALVSIIPFVLVPDAAVPRSGIYFYIFSFIFFYGIIFKLFYFILSTIIKKSFKPKLTFLTIFLVIFSFFNFFLIQTSIKEIIYDLPVRNQMVERNTYLRNLQTEEKNKDLEINPIQLPVFGKDPQIIHFFEIKEDKSFRVNVWISEYFGLKSVRIKK